MTTLTTAEKKTTWTEIFKLNPAQTKVTTATFDSRENKKNSHWPAH